MLEDSKKHSEKKILVIGLGQIGYSNAEYMTSLGLKVDGYDISEQAISRALKNGVIQKKATSFRDYDYYIICISTHRPEDMFVPYLDGLMDIAARLSHEGKGGALVGIDSTVTRGTSQEILKILGHRLHVVHVPHRFFIHDKDEHGVKQTRVLGGCSSCCTTKAISFYGNFLGIPLHIVSSADVAELTKVVENSYRFMEIAFAEELRMVCENIQIDFNELRNSINTKWNIKILEARDGVGGHCLPKDSQMFLDLSRNILATSIIQSAKAVDEQYRLFLEKQVSRKVPLARR
jgi:UDP-N-acetyl-D-mannosaminuronic acid dehydrogenase